MIIMDNYSAYYSERIGQLAANVGVKIIYLPPYSPDFNLIEELFNELKAYLKKEWCCWFETPYG